MTAKQPKPSEMAPVCDRRHFMTGTLAAGGASLAACALSAGESDEHAQAKSNRKPDKAGAQREHARKLHRDSTVIVIHDHNPVGPDIEKMLVGGVTCKVYQLGVDVDIGPDFAKSAPIRDGWSKRAMAEIDAVEKLAGSEPRVLIAKSAADIVRAKREGKIAILLGVEGAKLLDGKVSMLLTFYDRGLRELQLRWAFPNQVVEAETLTNFGQQVVRQCGKLGVIVGLTHIPTTAFYQVIEMTEKPPIVCHGAAARSPHRKGDLLGDRQLRALAGVRGVVGLHFYSAYLGPRPTVDRVVEQVDYIANLVGIDTVGLGIDFFPTEGPWGEFQRGQGTKDISWAIPDLSHMAEVTEALAMRNFPDDDIKKVLGGNFLRVCQEVFGG